MRKEGTLAQREARRLGRQIVNFLKMNHKERACHAGEAIVAYLEAGDVKEAWRTLRGRHREAGNAATKP